MKQLQKLYPHFLVLLGFIAISLIYFYPVLKGKKIYQSDIVQYTAMAKEQNDFRASEHTEPYWTNSSFGGMPTYQMGAHYPNDFVSYLDNALRFLPRPADYLFLYFLGFYVLLLVLKIDPLKAFFGALAFGFSTYLIIILGVGHNAKAHAIAYLPLVVAGTILVFKRKYILGGLLTMFAVALELNANHFQMTYYGLFLLSIIGIYYSSKLIKEKNYNALYKIAATFVVALLFAIGSNATELLATKQFAVFSTRGKSDLKLNSDGTKKGTSTLDKNYITEYSYGILESFDLIAPRLFGGSNSEVLDKSSEMVQFLQHQQVAKDQYMTEEQAVEYAKDGMPTYWGDQPIVAAPAYIGVVVFFLFMLGLFNDNRKIKYVFLAGAILSLLLSWGKNLSIVTDFMIDYFPMYDKFRAVSSIQIILEMCIPVLAILGLQSFFQSEKGKQWNSLWKAAATCLGIIIALFLFKSMFDFTSSSDREYIKSMGPDFVRALKMDRKTMYSGDLLRSGFFILMAFGMLYLYIKNKLSQTTSIVLVGLFMVADLFLVDKNYVSNTEKQFRSPMEVDEPFQANQADSLILEDHTNFRVFELAGGLSNSRASYFHNSIGGYSAVKPRKIQELYDYQIEKNLNNLGKIIDPKTLMITKSIPVLNALNVKYLIVATENHDLPIVNPFFNGNAWFVKELKKVNTADEEMKAMGTLDTKNIAIFKTDSFTKSEPIQKFETDSTATITAKTYKPNYLNYISKNAKKGFAVFSETYYKDGWNAYIDGKKSDYIEVDYTLRGMEIPAGTHTVEFKFEPQVVKTGSTITLFASIGMLLLLIGGIYFDRTKRYSINL